MYHESLESFITFCDDVMIAEEGKLLSLFFKKKPKETTEASPKIPKHTLTKASSSTFDYLVDQDAMCFEGLKDPNKPETCEAIAKNCSEWEGCPDTIKLYYCFGRDLNKYYHLTGNNQYPNNLGIFFIDWSNFPSNFEASRYKGNTRWFSDVVDNNARREIRSGNKYYKNYHSVHGDDWFYSTI